MHTQKPFDWYQAQKGNRQHLPQSQAQGIQTVQEILVPIQAQIALVSGRYAADVLALKFYARTDQIVCERCNKTLTKSGDGHDTTNCELYKRASEVLMSDKDECKRSLLLEEQERLEAKLDRTNRQLARINGRNSQ